MRNEIVVLVRYIFAFSQPQQFLFSLFLSQLGPMSSFSKTKKKKRKGKEEESNILVITYLLSRVQLNDRVVARSTTTSSEKEFGKTRNLCVHAFNGGAVGVYNRPTNDVLNLLINNDLVNYPLSALSFENETL